MIADIKDITIPCHYVQPFRKISLNEPKSLSACNKFNKAPLISPKIQINEALLFNQKKDILLIDKENHHFNKICDVMVPDAPFELITTQVVEPGQKKCKPIAGETPCANTLEDYPDDVRLANADCKCIT